MTERARSTVVSEGARELSQQEWCTAVEEAGMNSSIVFLDIIPGDGLCITTALMDETTNYLKRANNDDPSVS